jgi:hypothetical protein
LVFSTDGVTVPAGTYLVSYSANGSVPTGDFSISLYLDGAPLSGQEINITPASADQTVEGSKSVLVTTTGGTFALYNTSTDSATFDNASLTVIQAS